MYRAWLFLPPPDARASKVSCRVIRWREDQDSIPKWHWGQLGSMWVWSPCLSSHLIYTFLRPHPLPFHLQLFMNKCFQKTNCAPDSGLHGREVGRKIKSASLFLMSDLNGQPQCQGEGRRYIQENQVSPHFWQVITQSNDEMLRGCTEQAQRWRTACMPHRISSVTCFWDFISLAYSPFGVPS